MPTTRQRRSTRSATTVSIATATALAGAVLFTACGSTSEDNDAQPTTAPPTLPRITVESTPITPAPDSSTAPIAESVPNEPSELPLDERGSVRLANTVIDVVDLELCLDGQLAPASGVGYGDMSIHVASPAGDVAVGLSTDGTCDSPPFEDVLMVGRDHPTTIVAVGSLVHDDVALFALEDDVTPPPPGLVRSRAFHGDPEAGALDLGAILEDGTAVRAFGGLTYGSLATSTEGLSIDLDTGYVALPSFRRGTHYGAFRSGTDHQIVDIVGPYFEPDGVYSVYPIGAVISGRPPAEVMVCTDTDASEDRSADCTTFPATVVGDPSFST